MELGNAVFVKAYQFFTKSEIAPAGVQFVHRYDGDTQEREKILGCLVAFGNNQGQVILHRRDLGTPYSCEPGLPTASASRSEGLATMPSAASAPDQRSNASASKSPLGAYYVLTSTK